MWWSSRLRSINRLAFPMSIVIHPDQLLQSHTPSDTLMPFDYFPSTHPVEALPPYSHDDYSMHQLRQGYSTPAVLVSKESGDYLPIGISASQKFDLDSPSMDDLWFTGATGDAMQMAENCHPINSSAHVQASYLPSPTWSSPSFDAATSAGSSPSLCDSPSQGFPSAGPLNPAQQSRKAPNHARGAHPAHLAAQRSDQSARSVSGQLSARGMETPAPRPGGACSRCKRLKMKCIFNADGLACTRCGAGGHDCIVEGRKPRTPGIREQLVRQIREKNQAINDLLSQLHCMSETSTPLSMLPSRMVLKDGEREVYRPIFDWIEKRHGGSRAADKAYGAFDISELDDDMSDSDLDDEDSSDGMSANAPGSTGNQDRIQPHLYSLPDATAPLGFLAKCSLNYGPDPDYTRSPVKGEPDEASPASPNVGIANDLYFRPSPFADLDIRGIAIERDMVPEILASGLISADEGRMFFDAFFEKINPFLCLLDEAIHTPVSVLRRCPFLFTVVCAVSSRYYTERPEVYKMAMHFAKASAASAFIDGWKCIEMVQAYLIMAAYGVPTRRWEEDRSWFYTGVAVRLATELDLNRPSASHPSDERYEREMLNRYRTWMICCIIDGSICLQLGKPSMTREDEIMQNPSRWCSGSNFQHPFDEGLPDLIELQRIMNRFMDIAKPPAPCPLSHSSLTIAGIVDSFAAELSTSSISRHIKSKSSSLDGDIADNLRTGMAIYFLQYCRLLVFVFGLQSELENKSLNLAHSKYLPKCLEAASSLTNAWTQQLGATGHMKFAPDFFFIATGFAGAFLIKLLHPRFMSAIDEQQRLHIMSLVTSLIQDLSSSGVSIDEQHTPRLYARFLEGLLHNITNLWTRYTPSDNSTCGNVPVPGSYNPSYEQELQSDAFELLTQTDEGWQHLRAHVPGGHSRHVPDISITPPFEQKNIEFSMDGTFHPGYPMEGFGLESYHDAGHGIAH